MREWVFNCCGDLNRSYQWLQSEGGSNDTLYRQKNDSALMHKIPMSIFLDTILTSTSEEDGMAKVIDVLDDYNRENGLNPENRSFLSRASYLFRPHKTNDHSMKLMVVAGTSADGRPLYREANADDNFDDVFAIQSPGEYLDTTPESLKDELSAVATLENFLASFKLFQAKAVVTAAPAAVTGSPIARVSAASIGSAVFAKDLFPQLNDIYKTCTSGKDLSKHQWAILSGCAVDILSIVDANTTEVLSPQTRAILFGVTELVKKLFGQELSQSAEVTAGASEGAGGGAAAADRDDDKLEEPFLPQDGATGQEDTAGFAESTKDQAFAAWFAELLEAFCSGTVGVASLRQVFAGLLDGAKVIPELPAFSTVDFAFGGAAAVGSSYVTWLVTLISKEASGFSVEELNEAKDKLKKSYPKMEELLSYLGEDSAPTARTLRMLSRIVAASSEPLKDTAVLYALLRTNSFSLRTLVIVLTAMFPMRFFKEYSVAQKPYADLLNQDLMLNTTKEKVDFLKDELSMTDTNIKDFFDTKSDANLSYNQKATLVMEHLVDKVASNPRLTQREFDDLSKKCQWLCYNFLGVEYSNVALKTKIDAKFDESVSTEEGASASTEAGAHMTDKEKKEGLLGMLSEEDACQRCIRRCFAKLPRVFIDGLRQATPPAMACVYGYSAYEGLKLLNEAATGTKSILDMSPTSSVPTNAIIITLNAVWASNIAQGALVAAEAVESQFNKMTNEARTIAELETDEGGNFVSRSKRIFTSKALASFVPDGEVPQSRAMTFMGAFVGASVPNSVEGDFTSGKPPAPEIVADRTGKLNSFAVAGALSMSIIAHARDAMYWTVASDKAKTKLQELKNSGASEHIKGHYTNLIAAYQEMAELDKRGNSRDDAATRAGRSALGSSGGGSDGSGGGLRRRR